ncbi:MAG TPA: Na+/H+ antiporter [Aeromicrobium sp.]|nr:Na+/H+ antiporter [Aeromicrobium sp.]
MEIALTLVTLVAIAIAGSVIADRYTVSTPLLLIVVGSAASFVPMVPEFELTPTIVLVGLLPPLLYASAIQTSLIDFAANRRPIALLSIGLVVFTVAGVGAVVHALLPVPWPVAFALGAVVAPPDAVAASAVARRVGMPRRVVTILEGESLVNDATAIVTLRAAIAATAGVVSAWKLGLGFVIAALGGSVVGLAVALVVARIRRRLQDDLADVAVSLLTPWVAYVLAEQIHVPGIDVHPSGVLAVVVAGLLLGHKSPAIQSATSRLFERTNWATLSFVLENSIFLLIGLQARSIVGALADESLGVGHIALVSLLVLGTVIALRMMWIYPATYLPRLIPSVRRVDPPPPWTIPTVVGWAGMRGVVTLAAVFLLPPETPHRPVLVMIAFVVTVGTLLLQGLTLPSLLRLLKVSGPDPHEDHIQEATAYQSAVNAGLAWLDSQVGAIDPDVADRARQRALDRTNAVWERLGGLETPSAQYSRARAAMLEHERAAVLDLRRRGTIDQAILRRVLAALDVEESILDTVETESTADREDDLRVYTGNCDHLRAFCSRDTPPPRTPGACEECLRDGTTWVALRLCLTCGHVGCCNSSPSMHADAHFASSGHPVMRSIEPGEAWRWCYVDEIVG